MLESTLSEAAAFAFAPPPNPLAALSIISDSIKETAQAAGGKLVGPAFSLLGALTAYRIIRAWLESAFDGDAMSLINEAIISLVVATILSMGLTNYEALSGWAWGLGSSAMEFVGGGSTANGIMDSIWKSTISSAWGLLSILLEPDAAAPCKGLKGAAWAACKMNSAIVATGANILVGLFIAIALLLLLIFMGIMMYQVLRGIFQIAVGLLWLPLTMGFYPLIDSWFKNAVGLIASGIANMAMVSILIKMVGDMAWKLTENAMKNNIIALPPVMDAMGRTGAMNKMTAVLIACLGIVIIAFLASAAMSYGTSIFGAVSGWGSIKTGKPSGGGKPASKSSETGGVEKAGPAGSGAIETAAKVGEVAAGVASGGATTATGSAVSAGAGGGGGGAISKMAGAFEGAVAGGKAGAAAGGTAGGGSATSRALGGAAGALQGAISGSRMAGRAPGAASRAGRAVGRAAGAKAAAGGLKGAAASAGRLAGRAGGVAASAIGRGVAVGARAAAKGAAVGAVGAAKGAYAAGKAAKGSAGAALRFYARNANNS